MTEEIKNKQIVLKHNIDLGEVKETDFLGKTVSISLKVPEGSNGILVKNLYLSCDPNMRPRMTKMEGSYVEAFTPGQVTFTYILLY